jgi:hypothetical protein
MFLQAPSRQQSVVAVAGIDWQSAKFATVRIKIDVKFVCLILQASCQEQSVVIFAEIDWKSATFAIVRINILRMFCLLISCRLFSNNNQLSQLPESIGNLQNLNT